MAGGGHSLHCRESKHSSGLSVGLAGESRQGRGIDLYGWLVVRNAISKRREHGIRQWHRVRPL